MNSTSSICPPVEVVRAFGQGRLEPGRMAEVERHVMECASCCEALSELPADTLMVLAREAATRGLPEVAPGAGKGRAGKAEANGGPEGGKERTGPPPELLEHPRYRVLGLVGVGGMGAVYKAQHRVMERLVALKVIRPTFVANKQAVERFHREVKTAARLAHPNIVTAFDAEQSGETHFLVMEFVDGVSLDRFVAHNGPLAPQAAANLIRQAAQGLDHAHRRGMIHRDIKPHNLMITKQGELKILDFGLARFANESAGVELVGGAVATDADQRYTQLGVILGTPDYLAPEQAKDSRAADIRSDIYALGCTFFFLLTGRAPFAGKSPLEKVRAHESVDPDTLLAEFPEVAESVGGLLRRMMARRPEDRFQSPEELLQALASFRRGRGTASNVTAVAPAVAAAPTVEIGLPAPSVDYFGTASIQAAPFPTYASAKRRAAWWTGKNRHLAGWGAAAAALVLGVSVIAVVLANRGGDGGTQLAEQRPDLTGASGGSAKLDASTRPQKSPVVTPHPAENPPLSNSPETPPVASSGASSGTPVGAANAGPSPLATDRTATTPRVNGKRQVLLVIPKKDLWYTDYGPLRERLEASGQVEVLSASTKAGVCQIHADSPGPREGVTADVDFSPELLERRAFDAVVFIGADTWPFAVGSHKAVTAMALEQMAARRGIVSGICLGQTALMAHGALRDRSAAWGQYLASRAAESGAKWDYDSPVVIDRSGDYRLITSGADRHANALADALLAELRTP